MIQTRSRRLCGRVLLVGLVLFPWVCVAQTIDHFTLQAITVTGVAAEYITGMGQTGASERFLTGRGRFYDSQGRSIRPGGALARGDVLYVVYRATDRDRTVLTGVLRPSVDPEGSPTCRTRQPQGAELTLDNGVQLRLVDGWNPGSARVRNTVFYGNPGRLSSLTFSVTPAVAGSTDDVVEAMAGPDLDPLVCARDLVVINDRLFAHQQSVCLYQRDLGAWEYESDILGKVTGVRRVAAPLHELTFRDVLSYRSAQGFQVEATSFIPVEDYANRIPEVRAMVSGLRFWSEAGT